MTQGRDRPGAQPPGEDGERRRGWISFRGRLPLGMVVVAIAQIVGMVWQAGQIVATLDGQAARLGAVEQSIERLSAVSNAATAALQGMLERTAAIRDRVDRVEDRQITSDRITTSTVRAIDERLRRFDAMIAAQAQQQAESAAALRQAMDLLHQHQRADRGRLPQP